MTTADWAFVISLASVAISAVGFIWNVWSKFIYPKPRVRVGFARMHTIDNAGEPKDSVLVLSATNFGPGPVTLQMAVACERWHWQREVVSILNPFDNFPNPRQSNKGPFAGGLPKKLEVGEEHTSYFPVDAEFARPGHVADHPYVGFHDIFGRQHLTRINAAGTGPDRRPLGTPLTRAWKQWRKIRGKSKKEP